MNTAIKAVQTNMENSECDAEQIKDKLRICYEKERLLQLHGHILCMKSLRQSGHFTFCLGFYTFYMF